MDIFSLAQDLTPQLDATAVADLMFIACNEGSDSALSALCPHDAGNTKLLSSIATDKVMAVDFSSRPPVVFVQQQQQHQQLQQQTTQQSPQQEQRRRRESALLHEQLLLTCLVGGHVGTMQELLNLKSAAGNLSESDARMPCTCYAHRNPVMTACPGFSHSECLCVTSYGSHAGLLQCFEPLEVHLPLQQICAVTISALLTAACHALLPVLLWAPGAASVGKLMQAAALLGNPRPPLGHGLRTALDMLSELPAAKVCGKVEHSCHKPHCSA
jgi:hypothetical protein